MLFRYLFSAWVVTSAVMVLAPVGANESRATESKSAGDELTHELRFSAVLHIVMARNPDLDEARARAVAAAAAVGQARALGDLQLKYEQWGVPLRRPFSLGAADALMVGVSQTFPAPGSLRARVAMSEALATTTALSERRRRQELATQARRAFAAYYRADRQLLLHQEHVALTDRLLDVARASYRAGSTTQQDVLRLTLELSRAHGQLARMEPERHAAAALLNALMNRRVDEPLGPPAELFDPAVAKEDSTQAERTELATARKAIERSEAGVALSKANARWPSFMLGLDYMYMPMNDRPHGYGAMVALNLPWFNAGKRHEIRAAEASLSADKHALTSVTNALQFEVIEARSRYEAARASYDVIDRDVVLQAERNLAAAQSAYASGRGDALILIDALRSHLDVRLERVRAIADLEVARADLDRALGRALPGDGL